MKMITLAGGAALLVAAAAPAAAPEKPDGGGDREKVTCRTYAKTGSRLSRTRLCMTAKEWAEHDRTSGELLEREARSGRRSAP